MTALVDPAPDILDLQRQPLALNDRWQVTADGLQWIVQKRRLKDGRASWTPVIYCQTKSGLTASIRYEVYEVGEIDPNALDTLILALPGHRRLAPGWSGWTPDGR